MSQQKLAIFSWFKHKHAFLIGFFIGLGFSAGAGFVYLQISQDSMSVKNGQLALNKITTTNTTNASNGGVSNSGSNSNTSRDNSSHNTSNSPEISGNYNTITIISNRDLPGFSGQGYSTPPPELGNYSQGSNFQLNELLQESSAKNINFAKKGIIILGKQYTSSFEIGFRPNYGSDQTYSNRFVFQLDGSQKAAIIQFGIPDLTFENNSPGAYSVKIYSDGNKLLWAGECQRSKDSQIVSISLSIPDAKLLTIQVSSNGQNDTNLFFTRAQILK